MSTNPSVSATSPEPRAPGPPAAEQAGPWESQHLCSSEAGGAGAGEWDHPAAPGRASCPPAARSQSTASGTNAVLQSWTLAEIR